MEIVKKEINIDSEIKKKVEIICSFTNTTPIFKSGSVNKISGTNLVYVEPHQAIIGNQLFLFFNGTNNIFLNNLNNKYELKDLEKLLKQARTKKCLTPKI